MGFSLKDILGPKKDRGSTARSIADVDAALGRLGEERRAAREGISAAMSKRDELLLVDGTDAKIAELEKTADRLRLALERCDKAEPLLLEEMQALRDQAKRERWRLLCEQYDAAAAAYAASLRATIEAHEALIGVIDEMARHGFANSAAAFPTAPRIVARDGLNLFEAELDRRRDAAHRAPPFPAPVPVARPQAPAHARPAPPTYPTTDPKPPFKPTFDEHGLVRVEILKAGVPVLGRPSPKAGEVLSLAPDQAAALVRANAAEYVEFLEEQARGHTARRGATAPSAPADGREPR